MDAFFLPGAPGTGQRLCLHHAPAAAPVARLLYLHPWAEEMNKSRRMAALQSRALAAAGCAVLQIDLQGCGDSSGDFADASWAGWLADADAGLCWLRERHGDGAPLWIWGLRAGALLAVQAAARADERCQLLLWQPPAGGSALVRQFLRLKLAAGLQPGGDAKGVTESLRRELAAGCSIDIAGYTLAPALAQGLEAAELTLPPAVGRVVWLEVSTREPAALLPASAAKVQAWRDAGIAVDARAVHGPAFWQTQEIEDAPELLAATLDAVTRGPGAASHATTSATVSASASASATAPSAAPSDAGAAA